MILSLWLPFNFKISGHSLLTFECFLATICFTVFGFYAIKLKPEPDAYWDLIKENSKHSDHPSKAFISVLMCINTQLIFIYAYFKTLFQALH
ncbi:hypothetical protein A9Q77_04495 [Marinomonas sp. 42_23_T18]|nr:hypothetical protein A9Q77_04495 [Marinomonas sp. 42_23_T18]